MRKGIVIIAMFFVFLAGCDWAGPPTVYPYEFVQDSTQIAQIDIIYREAYTRKYNEDEIIILKVLEASEHQQMLNGILELQGGYRVPPPGVLGYYIIRITYKDGTKELVSFYGCAHLTPEGEIESNTHWNYSFFDNDAFLSLISSFVGESVTEPPYVE